MTTSIGTRLGVTESISSIECAGTVLVAGGDISSPTSAAMNGYRHELVLRRQRKAVAVEWLG